MESDVDMNSFLMDVLPNVAANATTAVMSSVDHLTGLSSIAGGFHDAMLESAETTQNPMMFFGADGVDLADVGGVDTQGGVGGGVQFFSNATVTQVNTG